MSFMKIDVVEIPFQVAGCEAQETLQLSPLDFGGPISSPFFVKNPTFVVDVEERSNFHFKLAASTPSVNCRIYLICVPPDLEDIRCAGHKDLDQSSDSGAEVPGVAELNSVLDQGRYLLVASLNNRQAVEGTLQLSVNTWVGAFSEHPCVSEKKTPFTDRSFSLSRVLHSDRPKNLRVHKHLADWWRVMKLPGMKKRQGLCYSEFLRNPGGLLRFNKRGRFQLQLSSTSYCEKFAAASEAQRLSELAKPPYLTVCLLRVISLNSFEVVLDDNDYTSAAWGYWTS